MYKFIHPITKKEVEMDKQRFDAFINTYGFEVEEIKELPEQKEEAAPANKSTRKRKNTPTDNSEKQS